MPNVYVINQSGHDYSEASHFGPIIFLSRGSINRYSTNNIYRQFTTILKDSSPDDFLLVTGLTVMNAIAASIMTHLHGKVNFLLFKQGKYIERTVVIGELF